MIIDSVEQLHAIIRRFDELIQSERTTLNNIASLTGKKSVDKFTRDYRQFDEKWASFLATFPHKPSVKEVLEKLNAQLKSIAAEITKLSYYEIADAQVVAQAKLECPKDHRVQQLLDEYLARALGEKWPQLKTSIDIARKISE